MGKVLWSRIIKKSSFWVGLFGDVYITTGCFDRSVKTCDDVNIPWKFNNQPILWLKDLPI